VRVIPGTRAWKNVTRKTLPTADVSTPFGLSEHDRFFFIGSCLARQMEPALRKRGLTVLSTGIPLPPGEISVGLDVVYKTNIASVLQEISWALGPTPFPTEAFVPEEGGLWHDLQLPGGVRPVRRERALERRRDVQRYFARIADATVVVLDLCGNDVWFDRATGLALNVMPSYWSVRREPERFEYGLCGFEDLRSSLLELRQVLGRLHHAMRIILTVNPMPLATTFRGGDIHTVETSYRSTLRVVAGELADEYDDIAYFPTLEAFTYPPRAEVFDLDDHVRQDVVDGVMASMLRAFGVDREPSEPDYDEGSYLRANTDVAALVRSGAFPSGYHHWLVEGRAAGRRLFVSALQIDDPIDPSEMRATITASVPERVETFQRIVVPVTITNTGTACYATAGRYPVHVCYRWYDQSGEPAEVGQSVHTAFADAVLPGESVTLAAEIATPQVPGRYTLVLTLLQQNVAWFDDVDAANGVRASVLTEDPLPLEPRTVTAP
jgi:GSCFA family